MDRGSWHYRWPLPTGDPAGCANRQGPTDQAIYLIVRDYARQIGVSLAPHDLRRTFAQFAHRGRSPLEQIQLSLGDESILTTERYLGVLSRCACDRLGIEMEP